jgi:hypothetical protein
MNSYDHLKSGDFDVIVEKGKEKLNLSELLRDLYCKVLFLEKSVASLLPNQTPKTNIGGPQDVDN